MLLKSSFLIFFMFLTGLSWGYPNYIGHGYTSCLNCHFNPFGNGPLNDYGRAVSATLISARWAYPKTWTEEEIAEKSGFLFKKPKQDWFRTQINYRRFKLTRNPGSDEKTDLWITMQADARAIIKFGENDRFVAVYNYGQIPPRIGAPPGEANKEEWKSREHYLGYRFNPRLGLYAGLMDKVFGVRVVEHIAFSRTQTQNNQSDQTHGVAMHFLTDNWEGGVHGFVGNLDQNEDLRMKGGSTMIERNVGSTHRVGASYMNSSNSSFSQQNVSVHARLNLKEGSSIIGEIGQIQKEIKATQTKVDSRYGLLQTYLRPTRGIYVYNNIEYLKSDLSNENFTVRWGPGVQVFPVQKIELRADIYNTRAFGTEVSTPDSWVLLLQTHLWL